MLELKPELIDASQGKLPSLERTRSWFRGLAWLPSMQRTMLEFALTGRASCREIADLTGMSAGTVNRCIKRYQSRLTKPIVRELCNPRLPIHAQMREIGLKYYLLGQPIKHIARDTHKTSACIRRDLLFIDGYIAGLSRQSDIA